MLLDIITRLSVDTSLDVVQQRAALTNLANHSGKALHQMLECNKIFREISLEVPPDKLITLPEYIGEIRGLRIHTTEMPFDLKAMAVPRYSSQTLQYKIKNWRDLGDSPLQRNLTLVGPLTFTSAAIETVPAVIIVTGQTDNSNRIEERVTMDTVSESTTNNFGLRIDNIACFSQRQYDITVTDDAGNIVAILANNKNRTRYKLIDVSQIFWPMSDTIDGMSIIDVLYKVPFSPFINDTDSFSAGDDYDDAIFHYGMYLYYLPMSGKENDSNMEFQRAILSIKSVKDGTEDAIDKKLNFGRGKFYDLFKIHRGNMVGDTWGYPYDYPYDMP
jgi:hypothetical protein